MKNRIKSKGYTLIELLIVITIIGIMTSVVVINVKKVNTDYTFNVYCLNLTNDIRMLQEKSVVNSNKSYFIILNADGYILKGKVKGKDEILKEVKLKNNFSLVNKEGMGFKNKYVKFRYDGGINCSSDAITIFVKNINGKKYRKITIAAIGGRVKLYDEKSNRVY